MEKIVKNPFFTGTTIEEIERMLVCFDIKKKTFKEKEEVCNYDYDAEVIGLLIEGSVSLNRINADGTLDILEYIEDCGIFGASLIFSAHDDAFMVVCEKPCTVLFIEKKHILKRCENACHHHTQVVQNLMELMAGKVINLTEKVDILSQRTTRNKLLSYFKGLSAKTNSQTFTMPFSLLALANYLCVDRSAMMRELKKMKDEGLVETNGNVVTLLHT